jgi:hypothetical protein
MTVNNIAVGTATTTESNDTSRDVTPRRAWRDIPKIGSGRETDMDTNRGSERDMMDYGKGTGSGPGSRKRQGEEAGDGDGVETEVEMEMEMDMWMEIGWGWRWRWTCGRR